MKERPIIFSDTMVRAIRDGRKTQLRRPVKPQPEWVEDGVMYWRRKVTMAYRHPCPFGQPGDRLWVKERWRVAACYDDKSGSELARMLSRRNVQYEAAGDRFLHGMAVGRVHSPVTMPRWASRITLEVTRVRMERLSDMTTSDALREGIDQVGEQGGDNLWRDYSGKTIGCRDPLWSFRSLWESINGSGSWRANPWVWVIEFRELEGGAVSAPCRTSDATTELPGLGK